MKREFTVMGICALSLLTVVAINPPSTLAKVLVLIIETGVVWAFVSAFRKG